MGCDIHIIAEVKENGNWKVNTDNVFKNPYYNPERWDERVNTYRERLRDGDITQQQFDNWTSNDSLQMSTEFLPTPSDSRNYDWFSILADVRNGIGFAGVKTGGRFSVISSPRGLPEDISNDALKYFCDRVTDDTELVDSEQKIGNEYVYFYSRNLVNSWVSSGYSKLLEINGIEYCTNPDYHSMSYLSVDDFDNFDWNQLTMKSGIISLEQYKELKDTNESPSTWSGGISGPNIITVETDTADKILNGEDLQLKRIDFLGERETKLASEWNVYVQYNWPVVYRSWFEDNIRNVVEPLRELKKKYEDARIVFAFDN